MSLVEGDSSVKMAVLHEWLDAYAGSEQVFEAIAGIYPDADLVALSAEPGIELDLGGRTVRTTFLNSPLLRHRRDMTLPLMPLAWRALGRRQYDLVISSHHAFAHANRLAEGGVHLSYVHSPARYLWNPAIDERAAHWALKPVTTALKRVDLAASRRVTDYAANSTTVAARIQEHWGREARVIPPPVRVGYFGASVPSAPARDYVLGVGRWIPYKNLHRVIEAADVLGMPVKVAGRGPDKSRLVAAASAARVPVELIESPSDYELRSLYQNAACLVFPTVEDFGIVPVEAQAAGTPVVAPAEGGVLDTVTDGVSGVLLPGTHPVELSEGIIRAMNLYGPGIRDSVQHLDLNHFRDAVRSWVASTTSASRPNNVGSAS